MPEDELKLKKSIEKKEDIVEEKVEEGVEGSVEEPLKAPESGFEKKEQIGEGEDDATVEEGRSGEKATVSKSASEGDSIIIEKSEDLKQIESILEEDLIEYYRKMTPRQKVAFKKQGELVAGRLEEMFKKVKVKARLVLTLVVEWLRMIPGVNKYYWEQEAKNKTARLLMYKEERDRTDTIQ